MRILIVEDDRPLSKSIASVLEDSGYRIDRAETGNEGLLLAETGVYDCLILDIMIPEIDGLSIVKQLRKQKNNTPVLLLTAKDSLEDRVRGLDAGADDYLIKPFAIEELLARLRALLRRNGALDSEDRVACGPITVRDYEGYAFGHPLNLTLKEFELFEFFLRKKEKILTREQIFNFIWGLSSDANQGIVDVYVHHLRKKLGLHGCGDYIRTIRSIGYMFKESKDNV